MHTAVRPSYAARPGRLIRLRSLGLANDAGKLGLLIRLSKHLQPQAIDLLLTDQISGVAGRAQSEPFGTSHDRRCKIEPDSRPHPWSEKTIDFRIPIEESQRSLSVRRLLDP